MIAVTVKRDTAGICNGFLVDGHAGYDEYGKDIVCASVSVLVINTINSIEQLTGDMLRVDASGDGRIACDLVSGMSDETKLLLDSLLLGLQGIEEEYGDTYIRIFDDEID